MELKLPLCQIRWEDLLKHKLLDFIPRISESAGLGCGLRFCISNKFPSEADGADLGPTLKTTAIVDAVVSA